MPPAERLRVLQLLPEFGVGGAEMMVVNLMLHLDPERYEVRAVTFFDPRGTRFEGELAAHGLEVRYLGKRLGFDPRLFRRVHREVREFEPQVLHSHLAVLPYALPAYLASRTVPAFHTVHNLVEQEADRAGRSAARLLFGWRVQPVAVAATVRDGVKRMYGVDAPVIRNGIDLAPLRAAADQRSAWRRATGLPDSAFVFACVARLMPQKNHALLLAAFAGVARAVPAARLLLVGDGALRQTLEAQATALGITHAVTFLGVRDDVPAVLAAADAFVLASDFEGNPLSVMEALAAGKPVIATAVGGVPELVTHERNGLLVAQGDGASLTAAMLGLATSPALAQRLGAAAAASAVEFGVDAMVRAYAGLYSRALTGGGRLTTHGQ